jgi:hypothetical protein
MNNIISILFIKMYHVSQKNIQKNNNVVIVNPKLLVLSKTKQKDTLEIERREKNTYFDKILK